MTVAVNGREEVNMPDYRYRVVAFGPTGQARAVAGPALDTTPDADRRWADIADSMGNDWDGLTYTAERQEVTPEPPWETIPLRQEEEELMGTRADFYVGKGPEAEWLGSTHWDGYPDGFRRRDNTGLFDQPNATEGEWRENVTVMLAGRDDSCTPEQGWPWPWDDSDTTDYAYTWTEDGRVEYTYCDKWVKANEAGDEDGSYWDTWCARGRPNAKHANWPDMSARRDPDAGYGPGASRVGRIVIM